MKSRGSLRWWIGTLLLLSTIINYMDRQTLSVLAPYLKTEFSWSNSDFALLIIAFRIAYAVIQALAGRLIDRIGTRRGLTLAVLWYSCAAALTSFATGLKSFCLFRFLLGTGEAANWPGATKAVSEWFPRQERGWAVALFDSGSSVGGAIAPFLVLWIYHSFGSWRPVFVLISLFGFVWVALWRLNYYPPQTHPRISPAEREMILRDQQDSDSSEVPTRSIRPSVAQLVRVPQTWGVVLGRSLTDPVWFFVTDWFAIYLVSKGFRLEDSLMGFWVPFLSADLGNFFGGGFSSWLIKRGWSVGSSRKSVIFICGLGMLGMVPAAFLSNFMLLIVLFAVSTFSYAAWSTMAIVLPSDLYPTHTVATVSGMSGAGAGIGTVISTYAIGRIADRYSFAPILVGASIVPFIATLLVLTLVRNNRHTGNGWVRKI
jgi:MFS transporter, ACS family, aldohexuronate transporter